MADDAGLPDTDDVADDVADDAGEPDRDGVADDDALALDDADADNVADAVGLSDTKVILGSKWGPTGCPRTHVVAPHDSQEAAGSTALQSTPDAKVAIVVSGYATVTFVRSPH